MEFFKCRRFCQILTLKSIKTSVIKIILKFNIKISMWPYLNEYTLLYIQKNIPYN